MALNAAVLGPAWIFSPAHGAVSGWLFVGLVSMFAWTEAATAQGHDVSSGRASRGPMLTALLLLLVFLVALLTAAEEVSAPQEVIGAGVVVLGVAARRAAMRALGPAFVSEPRPLSGRDRVRIGLYAWVDHPSELGLLAVAGGAAILLGSFAAALVWALGLVPVVLVRMRDENRALAAFG